MAFALLSGCEGGGAPHLEDLDDQVAAVGGKLDLRVVASDPDGDELTFGFDAPGVPDVTLAASLSIAPDGQGVFTWTPLASQIGDHWVDFFVSDGTHSDRLTIAVNVQGAAGDASMPVFREPLGTGTILDLGQSGCVEVPILVEDPDSTSVVLSAPAPTPAGGELDASADGLTGTWTWCPDAEERATGERFELLLVADDGTNPAAHKSFLVVLRKGSESCATQPPQIEHTPVDIATTGDPVITALVTDDLQLAGPPVVLWAHDDPGDPLDYAALDLVAMVLDPGDPSGTRYRASVPHPAAGLSEGESGPLYYVVSAVDEDGCIGDSPIAGAHVVDVALVEDPDAGCASDDAEPNDNIVQALAGAPLLPGTRSGLTLCTGDDDWYAVELAAPSQIEVQLSGTPVPDLDLALHDTSGVVLQIAETPSSEETLATGCLAAGTYLVRVSTIFSDAPAGAYALGLGVDAGC